MSELALKCFVATSHFTNVLLPASRAPWLTRVYMIVVGFIIFGLLHKHQPGGLLCISLLSHALKAGVQGSHAHKAAGLQCKPRACNLAYNTLHIRKVLKQCGSLTCWFLVHECGFLDRFTIAKACSMYSAAELLIAFFIWVAVFRLPHVAAARCTGNILLTATACNC